MRGLEDLVTNSLVISPDPSVPAAGAGVASGESSSQVDCHGLLYNLSLVVPAVLFVAYLASQARRSFAKLSYGRSYVMIAYYALLWIVSVLNLVWCVLQPLLLLVPPWICGYSFYGLLIDPLRTLQIIIRHIYFIFSWQCTPTKEFSWNMLSLCTQSGMLFLEVSLIAFLLQGNHAGDLEAFTRTFVVSGAIVAADVLLKAIYLFGFGVPLFIDGVGQLNRVKWGLWIVHKLLLTAIYGLILFMYHSKWRERLPARPTFYNYISVMFGINTVSLFSCVLMENGLGFGFWLHGLITICYHSFYLPLLYMTFLADFFQEEDLRLENVYYSEMKDAGFFDADWE